MQTRRWVNQSQPQTLVIAVFLLYFTAALAFLFFGDEVFYRFGLCAEVCGGGVGLFRIVVPAAAVAGGYGIANERKVGYYVAVAAAAIPLVARLLFSIRTQSSPLEFDVIGLMFDVALFALLVHPMSREYVRVWFK